MPSSTAERGRLRDALRALRRGARGDARRRRSCARSSSRPRSRRRARSRRRLVRPDGTRSPATRTPSASVIELPLTLGRATFGTLDARRRPFERRAADAPQRRSPRTRRSRSRTRACTGMVERQALVDGLTGIANRRAAARTRCPQRSRAPSRLGTPLTLVVADLDDFKDVNDVHGHAVGDDVLREFAAVLRGTLRESDVAGPLGRRGVPAPAARRRRRGAAPARRARPRAPSPSARSSAGTGRPPRHLQLRRGPATRRETTTGQLFAAADRALYQAKRRGKNRVELAAGRSGAFSNLKREIWAETGLHIRAGGARLGRKPMPVETPSYFAQVIKDHLELKEKNSTLDGHMPIDRYKADDPFENHPLFKTEEQARLEETMDGDDPRFVDRASAVALARRRDRGERGARRDRRLGVRRILGRRSRARLRLGRLTSVTALRAVAGLDPLRGSGRRQSRRALSVRRRLVLRGRWGLRPPRPRDPPALTLRVSSGLGGASRTFQPPGSAPLGCRFPERGRRRATTSATTSTAHSNEEFGLRP